MAQPRRTDTLNVGVYVGRVTRVEARVCYVELPTLAPGLEYGPARYPAGYAPGAITGTGGPDPGHTHPFRTLTVGDAVAVAFLAGRRDSVVVLTVLA